MPGTRFSNLLLFAALSVASILPAIAQVSPGDDFFAYANAAWLEETQMPAGKVRWTAAHEIGQLTRTQVARVLEDTAGAPAGSNARKIADFRAAWLDEATIEARGMAPIKPMLDRIDRVRDKVGLARLLGATLLADADPMNAGVFNSSHLFGLAVEASTHGEKNYVAFLVQGGLGLPGRENYLGAEPAMVDSRRRYQQAAGNVLASAGFGTPAAAAKRAGAVVKLETAIAKGHATAEVSGNERNADNLWSRADFFRFAPGMDWTAFFTAAGLGRQQAVVAWQPSAVTGTAGLVASQTLQAWKDYLRVRVIAAYADVLPRVFAEQAAALRGADAQPTRVQRADEVTLSALGDLVGREYVARHFPAALKARVQTIAANVQAAFARRVAAASWMSPESKAMALAKLRAIHFGVGYPERWADDSALAVDPADAAGNLRRVADWRYRRALARLDQPVDNTQWSVLPQWTGALLMFQQNAYNFTASLLQAPKFDPAATDAMNYGAIGAIVGHEMSHFVDSLGSEYEADGRFRQWWTAADQSNFAAAYAPLVKQFSAYRPFPDAAIDGRLTLTENIADLGGLAAAFDAYRATLGERATDKEYVRQQDREFFIGFARAWRSKYREDGLRAQVTNDHAPENYRVATVRNIDAWYDAFDVRPGQRLYLAPEERARIW